MSRLAWLAAVVALLGGCGRSGSLHVSDEAIKKWIECSERGMNTTITMHWDGTDSARCVAK